MRIGGVVPRSMDIVQIAALKGSFNEDYLSAGEATDPDADWYLD